MSANAGRFVFSLFGGGVLTYGAQKYGEHLQSQNNNPRDKQFSSTQFQKLDQKLQSHLDDDPIASSTGSTFSGFNPNTWELPKPSPKMKMTFDYMSTTSESDMRSDGKEAAFNIAKEQAKKVITAPRDAVEKVQKGYDIAQGFNNNDDESIFDSAKQLREQTIVKTANSVGITQMLKAPTYFLPPYIGIPARMYLTAKAVGNAGREINKLNEPLENVQGPVLDVMKKRVKQKPTEEL